jgi:Domain of unknown function (DUF1902)
MDAITVNAEWHEKDNVWIATSDDIWGLAAQAPDLQALKLKVLPMIADLVELNSVPVSLREITVHFVARSSNILELTSAA